MDNIDLDRLTDQLKEELEQRKKRNSMYSMRSFARDIGVSKTTLSSVLLGERKPSKRTILTILDHLPHLVDSHSTFESHIIKHIEPSSFDMVSDWYYLAIFHLSEFEGNQASAEWIADKLLIELELAEKALQRLTEEGYIKIENNKMIRTSRPIRVGAPQGSQSIRKYHRQKLEQAQESIDHVPVDLRNYMCLTLPVSLAEKDLEAINVISEQFIAKIRSYFDKRPKRSCDDIYNVTVQLFPSRGQYEKFKSSTQPLVKADTKHFQ